MALQANQLDCILAALRFWQWQRSHADALETNRGQDILEIENRGGESEILTDAEIDALCEELNCGDLVEIDEDDGDEVYDEASRTWKKL